MKRLLVKALRLVQRNRRAYVVINVVFYGLVIVGALAVVLFPEVQQFLLKQIRHGLSQGRLRVIAEAYREGRVLATIGLTFAANLFMGALAAVTIPSLLVPFSGLAIGLLRSLLWGLVLSPADPHLRWAMIPHAGTLLLEGQAYVLAMLAAYIHGKAWLSPRSVGEQTHSRGYLSGLKSTASIYVLVVVVLAVAAIYEALEVIYLAPLLIQR